MITKHVAKSGDKAGQWVNCNAQTRCRNEGLHISEKQFYAVQAWLKETKTRKNAKDVTRYDAVDFLALSKKEQNEWMGKAANYARNQKGFSHTQGQDPFQRQVYAARKSQAAVKLQNQKFDVLLEQLSREQFEREDAERKKRVEEKKAADAAQRALEAAERAEKRKKAAAARAERQEKAAAAARAAQVKAQAERKIRAQREAALKREEEWKKNAGFVTFEDSYSNKTLTNDNGLNKNHAPTTKTFVNTPESLPETAEFAPTVFSQLKSVWSAAGVKANYSHVEEIKYPHRDNIVRVHGLSLTSSDQYALSSQVRKTRESIQSSHSSGVIKVRMQERFYDDYIKQLDASKESNKNFKYFTGDKKVEKVFLGRDMVEFDLEVYGDQAESDQSLFILSELPGGKVFSTGKKYEPKTSISFSFNDDEETKSAFNNTQKVVSDAKGKATNLKDNMFLEKAQTEYIPEAVAAYYKVKRHADPKVRSEGKKLFLEQMSIINTHVNNIQEEANNELLNQQRVHLLFLKERTGENNSSLNLRNP